MAWDITVELENRPGTIADLGEAAGKAGVNIDGVCGFPCEGVGVIHVLVEDVDTATSALQSAGVKVRDTREVLVAALEDRPGVMGELARKFADAGVNIDLLYLATDTRVVLGVDDIEAGRKLV